MGSDEETKPVGVWEDSVAEQEQEQEGVQEQQADVQVQEEEHGQDDDAEEEEVLLNSAAAFITCSKNVGSNKGKGGRVLAADPAAVAVLDAVERAAESLGLEADEEEEEDEEPEDVEDVEEAEGGMGCSAKSLIMCSKNAESIWKGKGGKFWEAEEESVAAATEPEAEGGKVNGGNCPPCSCLN